MCCTCLAYSLKLFRYCCNRNFTRSAFLNLKTSQSVAEAFTSECIVSHDEIQYQTISLNNYKIANRKFFF